MDRKPVARFRALRTSAHVFLALLIAGVVSACAPLTSEARASVPIEKVVMTHDTNLVSNSGRGHLKAALERAFVTPSQPDGLTMTVRVVNFSVGPAGFDFPRAPSYGKVIVTLTDAAGATRAREEINTHVFFPRDPEHPSEEDLIRDIVEDVGQYLKRLAG